MKYPTPNIPDLEKERKKLLVSGEDPKKLKEIQKKLDYFNWGIK